MTLIVLSFSMAFPEAVVHLLAGAGASLDLPRYDGASPVPRRKPGGTGGHGAKPEERVRVDFVCRRYEASAVVTDLVLLSTTVDGPDDRSRRLFAARGRSIHSQFIHE